MVELYPLLSTTAAASFTILRDAYIPNPNKHIKALEIALWCITVAGILMFHKTLFNA